MIALRPAIPADAAPIAALVRAAFATVAAVADPPPSALRETPESIDGHLGLHGGLVAVADGAIVGAILWEVKSDALYFGRLAVDPSQRGRGIARALVAGAEAEARRCGLPRMELGTRLVWRENRRLFADLGFVEVSLHAHEGYDQPTWVAMERRL